MMKKVKSFWQVFQNSLIPQESYYPRILREKFSYSAKYFITLIFLLNLIFVLSFFIKFNPVKTGAVLKSAIAALQTYPQDLKITVNNGKLMTSYNRPYFLWLDYQNNKKLILVIDETATPSKIYLYNSMFLITQKEVVMTLGKNNQLSVLPISTMQNEAIDKNTVNDFTAKLIAISALMPVLFLFVFVLLIILAPVFSAIFLFLYTVVASLIAYLIYYLFFKKKIQFKKTLQISLHAATLPLVLDYFFITFKPTVSVPSAPPTSIFSVSFPVLFLALLSVFIFAGLYKAHKGK